MLLLTGNKLASIKKRSSAAISVFQKTVSDLASVNEKIDTEHEARQSKIETLKKEQIELLEHRNVNERFIRKINEFLGNE